MSSSDAEDAPPLRVLDRSLPAPGLDLNDLSELSSSRIFGRSPQSGGSTSSSDGGVATCGPNDTSGSCQRSTESSSNTTLPIVLGVVIPLSIAFLVLIILHRRHVKSLRREDAEDKHGSLDFGWERKRPAMRKKKGAIPEMSITDVQGMVRKDRGISMDLSLGSPYLLPPELHHSRESLHSLSKSLHTDDDKYRQTSFIPDDGSIRSPSSIGRTGWDDSSSTYSGSHRRRPDNESAKGLLMPGPSNQQSSEITPTHVQQPPAVILRDGGQLLTAAPGSSEPELHHNTMSGNSHGQANNAISNAQHDNEGVLDTTLAELDGDPFEAKPLPEPAAVGATHGVFERKRKSIMPDPSAGFDFNLHQNAAELPANESPRVPHLEVTPAEGDPGPHVHESSIYEMDASQPSAGHAPTIQPNDHTAQDYPFHEGSNFTEAPEVQIHVHQETEDDYYDEDDSYDLSHYQDALGYDPRLLSMGMRPLPPDDPTENAEQRANRIRSFYKEYFDDTSKSGANRTTYYDGSENYIDDYYGTTGSVNTTPYGSRRPSMAGMRGPGRHRAMSNGSYLHNGPRAFSSASGRFGHGARKMPMQKKKMVPLQPLNVLPTPYKLQDDSMLPNPMDYAPPQVFKNQRAGTPDSLRGGTRAYSPSAKVYNPLVSSFDDLAVLPSPHQLRKSGTFTSLDFAPPRFASADSQSDSGSIRSHRSGVSRLGQHNIRVGAYRVSRIPKEVAGTKDELYNALQPRWDMTR